MWYVEIYAEINYVELCVGIYVGMYVGIYLGMYVGISQRPRSAEKRHHVFFRDAEFGHIAPKLDMQRRIATPNFDIQRRI